MHEVGDVKRTDTTRSRCIKACDIFHFIFIIIPFPYVVFLAYANAYQYDTTFKVIWIDYFPTYCRYDNIGFFLKKFGVWSLTMNIDKIDFCLSKNLSNWFTSSSPSSNKYYFFSLEYTFEKQSIFFHINHKLFNIFFVTWLINIF